RSRFATFESVERGERARYADSTTAYEAAVAAIMGLLLLGLVAGAIVTVRRARGGVDQLAARLEASDARTDALLEELEGQRRTDALPGIPNRDAFVERLESECAGARGHGGDVSLLLLDVEGLGRINESHGYAAGNAVLLRVAGLCT